MMIPGMHGGGGGGTAAAAAAAAAAWRWLGTECRYVPGRRRLPCSHARPPGPRRKDRSKMAAAAVLKYSRSNLGIPLTARLCLPLNGLSRFTQVASTDILVSAYTLATVVVLYSILLSWVEFSLTEGM